MHQDAANRVVTESPTLITPAVDAFGEPDRMRVTALVGKLRGVLQNQDRSGGLIAAGAGRRKMSVEDLIFFNSWIGEEPIGGFRIGPILAGEGNAAAHPLAQSAQQIAKPPTESGVLERPDIDLAHRPMGCIRSLLAVPCRHFAPRSTNQVLDTESQPIHLIQELSVEDLQKSQRLVGNRKPRRMGTTSRTNYSPFRPCDRLQASRATGSNFPAGRRMGAGVGRVSRAGAETNGSTFGKKNRGGRRRVKRFAMAIQVTLDRVSQGGKLCIGVRRVTTDSRQAQLHQHCIDIHVFKFDRQRWTKAAREYRRTSYFRLRGSSSRLFQFGRSPSDRKIGSAAR